MDSFIEIFPQSINSVEINCVNARDLHQALESKQEFTAWAKNRLGDFDEHVDFIVSDRVIKNPLGGRPQTDFILTLDTAKHIAMLERNEVGKRIRNHFIEVEKKVLLELEHSVAKLSEAKNSPFHSTQKTFTRVGFFQGKPVLNIFGVTKKSEVRIVSFGYNKAIAICNNIAEIQAFVDAIDNGTLVEKKDALVFDLDI